MDSISIIFDTETTGLTKPTFSDLKDQPRIIELGAILVSETGEILETFVQIFNPQVLLSEEIKAKFPWTDEMLATKPIFADLIPSLRTLFYKASVAIGQNVIFDCNLVKYDAIRAGCDFFPIPEKKIDTVHEYFHRYGYRPKLSALYRDIIGEEIQDAHRALPDAMSVYKILMKEGFWNA